MFEYSIEHERPYVRVTVSGSPDFLSIDRLWHDILAACKRYDCRRILGESTTEQWGKADAYDHADVMEAVDLSTDYRIAWVERNPESWEAIKLVDAVAKNRGLDAGRVFDSVADAKRWLVKKAGGD